MASTDADTEVGAVLVVHELYGGDGNDQISSMVTYSVLNESGSAGDITNKLDGGLGDDVLFASSKAVRGSVGHRSLFGGAGNDSLRVEAGTGNTLDGGAGCDTLFGGSGADRFDFSKAVGTDHVYNFDGADSIRISGYGAALDEFADLHLSVSGGDTHIDLSASVAGAGEIILQDVSHVAADDFLFA
jgi:Ca2+-binding RTX toxin-like protein